MDVFGNGIALLKEKFLKCRTCFCCCVNCDCDCSCDAGKGACGAEGALH